MSFTDVSEPQPSLAWQFESSNVDSVTGLVPTSTGGAPTYVSGKYGQGINFPNSVSTGTVSPTNNVVYTVSLNATTGFTIAFWVNFNFGGVFAQQIISIANSGGTRVFWTYLNASNRLICGGPPADLSFPAVTLTTGTWYHVALVVINGTRTAYLNGQSTTSATTFTSTAAKFSIGGDVWVSNFSAWCSYDDLRIYNTALTAAQVQSVYTQGGAPASQFLVMPQPSLAWGFDGTTTPYIGSATVTTAGTSAYTPGKYGQALNIQNPSGTNSNVLYWVFTNSINIDSGLTKSVWVRFNDLSYIASGQEFVSLFDGVTTIDFKFTLTPSLNIYFQMTDRTSQRTIVTSFVPTVGVWYHTVMTASNGIFAGYINGVLYGTATYVQSGMLYDRLYINMAKYLIRTTTNADFDDLRIYNTALSAAQVQAVYAAQGMPSRALMGPSNYITSATGGDTVQDIGGYRIHTFTTVGTSTFTPATSGLVDVLVVGGGGGGGGNDGGGGSGGQVQYYEKFAVSGSTTVTVGAGGTGGPGNLTGTGGTGGSSVFGGITSIGGGGGATGFSSVTGNSNAYGGGSGGSNTINGIIAGPNGTISYKGGDGFGSTTFGQQASGGGGGAGGSGMNSSSNRGGDGGKGLYFSISGNNTGYGGGGGGGVYISLASITNGKGTEGGGNGGYYYNSQVQGTNGAPNTGGGGGGGADGGSLGRPGGSGIVIVRYPVAMPMTGTPLFSQLSSSAVASSVGAFSLRAVNGISTRAVQVRPQGQFPPAPMTSAAVQTVNQWTQTFTGYPFGGAGSYTANCSSYYNASGTEQPWRLFDDNYNGTWWTTNQGSYSTSTGLYTAGVYSTTISGSAYAGEWVQIQLPTAIVLYNYTIYNASSWNSRAPVDFKIAGSNDQTTWTLVDTQTGITSWTSSTTNLTFTPSNPTTAYTYYRLCVNKYGGGSNGYLSIGQWFLNGSNASWNTDFYADINGNLLTTPITGTTLANWLGSSTCYVTTWYDQSGKGNHATQATAANQPKIDLVNKQIDFKSSAYFNLPDGTVPYGNSNYTMITRHNTLNSTYCGIIGSGTYGTQNATNALEKSGNGTQYLNYWWNNDIVGGTYATGAIVSAKYDNTVGRTLYVNGSSVATNSNTNRASTSIQNTIGTDLRSNQSQGANRPINGELYYVFLFSSALSDADRQLVESLSIT